MKSFYKIIFRSNVNNVNNKEKYASFRSLMFVPGNQKSKLNKIEVIDSDVLVPDLEDSVPLSEKSNARNLVTEYLINQFKSKDKQYLFPRLNSLNSNHFDDDLDHLVINDTKCIINGLVIPKLNSEEEYEYINDKITKKEQSLNIVKDSIKLIVWIETTKGLVNIKNIFEKGSNRIVAASFGAEDYCNDLGIERTDNLKEVEVARSIFAFTANAFKITALDTPNVEFKNPESLIKEIEYVKRLGFKGKFAIHPSQIQLINSGFSPSKSQLEEAYLIIKEYEKGLKEGKGAISINNKMVDMPVYKRALNTINRSYK